MFARAPFSTARIYLRALREAGRYWPGLTLVLLLGLLGAPIALLTPVPVKIVVDNVLSDKPLPEFFGWLPPSFPGSGTEAILAAAIGLSILLAFFGAAHAALDRLVREYVAERMVMDFRSKLFLHSLRGSALRHNAEGGHEAACRITLDAPALQWTALHGFIPVVVSLTSMAAMLAVTWKLAPTLALVALATAAPVILLTHLGQRRMRGEWRGVRERESAARSIVKEALGAVRLVTLFAQEQRELDRFQRAARGSLLARLKVARMEGGFGLILGLPTALGMAAILFLGVRNVQAGALTAGGLLLILGYSAQLYARLQAIGGHIAGRQRAIAGAERAFALLDSGEPLAQRPDAMPLDRAYGRIQIEQMSFAYPGGGPVLDAVTMEIPAGSRVGVVGPSGAGKSTLIHLLIRLFDPTRGRILLDGVDLRDYRLGDLRNQFSVLSQEVTLFSASVAENIAYPRPDASREEIEEAARLSGADEFIQRLPEGYETRVGAGGITLSDGERQRLALARAFLKDAPILVLEEPTNALDRHAERHVRASMRRLMAGRTVFVITHQPGALQDVDFVLRVEAGRVTRESSGPRLALVRAMRAS